MSNPVQPTVLVIAGPTASGKSGLAMDVAEEFGGIVINADSMQVYAELRILTARPSAADEARVPHRLYGVIPAVERCSAGLWQALAVAEIEAAWHAGKLPIIVGGTGLYIRALTDGLSKIPDVPAAFRKEAQTLHRQLGGEEFLAELAKLDSETASRLSPGDSQRLIRAYEVAIGTGRPLSRWHLDAPVTPPLEADYRVCVLAPHRDELYAVCNARFDRMIEDGALDEVRALKSLGLEPDLPAMKALGVPELLKFLAAEIDLEGARNAAQQATRNYAKRQMTWFRNQIGKSEAHFAQHSESFREKNFAIIRNLVLTFS